MNKNYLIKACDISGIIGGVLILTVSMPLLITSHIKYKKEHPELKGTNLETRDDLMMTCVAGGMTLLSAKTICNSIINLKQK